MDYINGEPLGDRTFEDVIKSGDIVDIAMDILNKNNQDSRSKVMSPKGRMVYDTPENRRKREAYYKKLEEQHGFDEDNMARSIHRKNTGQLNILNSRQVSEMLHMSPATASNHMRTGIIPSFMIGGRRYTHDYVIDDILRRGKHIMTVTEFAYNKMARAVWRYDMGAEVL